MSVCHHVVVIGFDSFKLSHSLWDYQWVRFIIASELRMCLQMTKPEGVMV